MSAPADFAYGAANAALGLNDPERLREIIPVAIGNGTLARTILTYPNRPDSAPAAWLLAWPSPDHGLMSFIGAGKNGGARQWEISWPFSHAGIEHDFEIVDVYHDEDVPEIRLYEGIVGGHRLTVFDTYCEGCFSLIGVDDYWRTRIGGWASWLRRGSTEPHRFTPEQVSPDMREAFRETFEAEGVLVIHTDQLVSLFPAGHRASPLYELRSPVEAVRDGPPVLDMPSWILTVMIAREDPTIDAAETDVSIELTVTAESWRETTLPQVGDVVEGVVWLQAEFV